MDVPLTAVTRWKIICELERVFLRNSNFILATFIYVKLVKSLQRDQKRFLVAPVL